LTLSAAPARPRYRGVLHQWAFFLAIPLGIALGLSADGARERVAAAVFGGAVVAMFGASALYHRISWSVRARPWLRRVDHAGIFGLIAGSYTAFGLIILHGAWQLTVLTVVWAGSLAAVAIKFLWVSAPRWLSAAFGIALGWVGVLVIPQLARGAGAAVFVLVAAGGVSYTVGALVYARRRPDPFPSVFGYHEVFHALVIAAVALQYTAVSLTLS
jgi:hemolysin III